MSYHKLIEVQNLEFQKGQFRYVCAKCRRSFQSIPNGKGCHTQRKQKQILYPPELRPFLNQLQKEVSRILEGMGIYFWNVNGQSPRLLIWLQWSRILNITFENLVRMLIKEYRERLRLSGPALGMSLPALTGPRVQEWVLSQKSQGSESLQGCYSQRDYRSLDEYVVHIDDLRKMERQRSKAYRGSRSWVKPKEDKDAVIQILNLGAGI